MSRYTEFNVSTGHTRVVSATLSDNHALIPVNRTETNLTGSEITNEAIQREFPRYGGAAGLQCDVGPGEFILIPRLWHRASLA